jgi:adenylate cyclase
MTPEQLLQELNPYLDAVVSVIHWYEGMIDKFIGDGVFALWGIAPEQSDPVEQAFRCAQELLRVASQLSFGGVPVAIGIGLNAGRVFSGNVGNEGKRQFTVLGHPVNLAARFQSLTKDFGCSIVLGEDFARRLPATLFSTLHKHDYVAVRGAGLQTVYTYSPEHEEEKRGM